MSYKRATPIPIDEGGTSKATFTPVNGVVIGNATSPLGVTGAGTAGQIFCSNSPSAPAFASSTAADFSFTASTAATARTLTVSHSDNTSTSSTANYTASVGGTSAGDAWYQASVGSSRSYAWGVDNTDSQSFKITTAAASTVSPSSASIFMKITSSGEMTLPLQPGFSAYLGTTASNVTGNNTIYILGDTDVGSSLTEIFDNNGDFNPGSSSGALLTAPVDAKWWLCSTFFLLQANTSTGFDTSIRTSNRNYRGFYIIPSLSTSDFFAYNISVIADMDAGDTADIRVVLNGAGSDIVDVYGGTDARSCFYGWQLG